MVLISLCDNINYISSELIDVMLVNYGFACICVATGNKPCVLYYVYSEGPCEFEEMANHSASNEVAFNLFIEHAKLLVEGYNDIKKAPYKTEGVTKGICKLIAKMDDAIDKSGILNCPEINPLKLTAFLAILQKDNLKRLVSAEHIAYLLDPQNILNLLIQYGVVKKDARLRTNKGLITTKCKNRLPEFMTKSPNKKHKHDNEHEKSGRKNEDDSSPLIDLKI